MTAFYDKESCRRAMEAGAVALPAKPYGDEQLFQTIRSALTREVPPYRVLFGPRFRIEHCERVLNT